MKIKNNKAVTPVVGILEWFRPGEYEAVRNTIEDLKKLGITHLRTGISWADWHTEGAREWYDWLFATLHPEVEILPCFLYTPPSLGETPKTSSPPRYLKAYADFIDVMISEYGRYFEWVELWNEPNNKIEYDYTLDYSWNKFSKMIDMAAYWAGKRGKKTLLGGMSPIDPNWLQVMAEQGTLENIDAIGIHGFPNVFDQQWEGWEVNIARIREVLKRFDLEKELWISEAGFSTWQHDEVKQYEEFRNVLQTDADRVYWYSLNDLATQNATVGGYHLDEREYFFGLKKADGTGKLLYRLLEKNGVENTLSHTYIEKTYDTTSLPSYTLITGGAGFIGTNLASRLLEEGRKVMIYDNLLRDGVEQNLVWLREKYPENLIVQIADIREKELLEKCVEKATEIFHFSAQVAVTHALENPGTDFRVNLEGTFNLLEAIRKSPHQPPLLFTSTNKVYGNLKHLEIRPSPTRYIPENEDVLKYGMNEDTPLDFHSPYGCSKGAADQYILDYARCFGLKAMVFRMSCIYGPHQFGTEDQGWVAHFLISALKGKQISIYGDGKQVRDILYADDLIDAFLLASKNMDTLKGKAYNMGGGPGNSVSLREVLRIIGEKTGKEIRVTFSGWRTGDQFYYVSDTSRFRKATGWSPRYTPETGIRTLMEWLDSGHQLKSGKQSTTKTLAL